jgi:tRNA(Arg) A34 adenosine deaminase TadA
MSDQLSDMDDALLRLAIGVSARAVANGNMPFGAILADGEGNVLLESENTTMTGKNVLNHAETNLVNMAVTTLSPEQIESATLYTSCEPCAMCAGAMYWGGINRMIYAMSERDLLDYTGGHPDNPTMKGAGSRAVLQSGQRDIEVKGPYLISEAGAVQAGYWTD